MAWVDPRYLEHLRKRFTRADAYRFAPPGTPEAKMPGYLHPSARIAAFEKAQQEVAEQQAAAWALERELLEIRRELDEVKLALAARRAARLKEAEALRRKSDLAWDHFIRTFKRYAEQQKAGFNPDQPRDDHGKWTDSGRTGDAGKDEPRLVSEQPRCGVAAGGLSLHRNSKRALPSPARAHARHLIACNSSTRIGVRKAPPRATTLWTTK